MGVAVGVGVRACVGGWCVCVCGVRVCRCVCGLKELSALWSPFARCSSLCLFSFSGLD